MAIQQIQKSSTFKPDMIGDIVEVTLYNKADGDTSTAVGTLRAYSVFDGIIVAEFDGDRDIPAVKVPIANYNVSITHYEYILDLSSTEADE